MFFWACDGDVANSTYTVAAVSGDTLLLLIKRRVMLNQNLSDYAFDTSRARMNE